MNEPLHPSTLGEILDRTAQLYRSRFLLLLGISVIPTGVVLALVCAVALVVAWWSAAGAGTVSTEAGWVLVVVFAIAVALLALPVLLAATSLAMAAMSHAVPASIWEKRPPYAMHTKACGPAACAMSDSIFFSRLSSEAFRWPHGL